MHTFKKSAVNVLSLLAAVAMVFSLQAAVAAESAHEADGHHSQRATEWPGVYNGFIPCADCIGVKMSLALNANNTYILLTQYVGRSPKDFVEKGKFTWTENSNKITLMPRDGSEAKQYLVGDNVLVVLDGNGNQYTGKKADSYVLRRTDLSAKSAPKHAH